MLDSNEAKKILGVGKDASRYEIERKYSIILKRHRMAALEAQEAQGIQDDQAVQDTQVTQSDQYDKDAQEDNKLDIEMVTLAYNTLMGYIEPPSEEELRAPNPLMQKMGIDEKKTRNFFHYYKIHIILGIIALIVTVFTIRGCVTRVDPDFNLAFVGFIGFSETDNLKEAIKVGVPEIKEPGFDGAFLAPPQSNEQQTEDGTQANDQQTSDGTQANEQQTNAIRTDGQQEYAMQMKAMILFSAADIDLFILDKNNFLKYAEQGAFQSLDELTVQLGLDEEKTKPYLVINKDENKKHIYAINVADSKVLKDAGIVGDEMVAAIPVRSKNLDKAKKVIELFLK